LSTSKDAANLLLASPQSWTRDRRVRHNKKPPPVICVDGGLVCCLVLCWLIPLRRDSDDDVYHYADAW
jgi:hypothetical protein